MKKLTVAIAATLLFISCQNSNAPETSVAKLSRDLADQKQESMNLTGVEKEEEKDKTSGNIHEESAPPQEDQQQGATKQIQQAPIPKVDWDKKIIKNAAINLEVKDYSAYNTSLREKIKQFGGYVAQEEQTQSEYKIENTIVIKVQVDQFDDAVNSISSNVKELKEKKITSQDVTTEVIDTRSRMETKKQVRQRYQDLLKQAKNMEEVLNVQSVINGVQEEIESAAGRIEYLSHASSYSTITLTFFQVLNATAVENDRPSFATRVGNAFSSGWAWIGELAVAMIAIWPLLLLFFAVFVFYKRTRRPKVKQA